jgi:fatty-acid peroxygenase
LPQGDVHVADEPAGIQRLVELAADRWRERIGVWEGRERVTLFPALQGLYCRAVCEWAGIPLVEAEARQRTREFAAMIDGAGAIGPRNWRGQLLRWRTERWARRVVEEVRDGSRAAPEGSAVHIFATHRDLDGRLLTPEVAAVELINLLRATTAVARFVTFEALALHDHPEWQERLQGADDADVERFVQEVRRCYPFFPFIGERVLVDLEWQGHHFAEGAWLALDLDGTDHDARVWDDPEAFRPERFLTWDRSLFDFVPQGGGNHYRSHRCPGEWIVIALMKDAARQLTSAMRYDVPPQDLTVDRSRMPTIPASRFVVDHVWRLDQRPA